MVYIDVHLIIRNYNSLSVELLFNLLIQSPLHRPVGIRRNPYAQSHNHSAVCKLIHKYHHFASVPLGVRILQKNFFQNFFCLLNIRLIGNPYFYFQFSCLFCCDIDDCTVGKCSVRHHDFFVVNAKKCGVAILATVPSQPFCWF